MILHIPKRTRKKGSNENYRDFFPYVYSPYPYAFLRSRAIAPKRTALRWNLSLNYKCV